MIIYKIANWINEKIYIGQTVGSLETKWKRHVKAKDMSFFHIALNWHATKVINTDIDKIYDTVSAATKAVDTEKINIINVCKHKKHCTTCKGYHWEYYNE